MFLKRQISAEDFFEKLTIGCHKKSGLKSLERTLSFALEDALYTDRWQIKTFQLCGISKSKRREFKFL